MAYVDVDGLRMHVQDLGAGEPIVLIAGFGLDHQLWDRQVRVLLEAGYRVLAVDQRGHGRSDKPASGYEVATLARDVERLLLALEVGPATVVGHSFGGQVAFGLAAARPSAVSRLVLVGSNGVRASRSDEFPFGRPPEASIVALTGSELDDRLASRRATIASGFAAGSPEPHLVDWLVRISLQMPSWAAVSCYRSMLETDQLAALPHVTQPVLQVIGEADPVHSAKGARWLNERLADARLVEIPGCGHYPMLESAAAFDEALLSFLGDDSGPVRDQQ